MTAKRTEFGFERTECACKACVLNCEHISGYLIPSDLETIAAYLGYDDLVAFAVENLLASPGAIVMKADEIFRIPTLVPKRRPSGVCKFLTAEYRGAIHPVAPYACSMVSCSQSKDEADLRSGYGLHAIAREWATGGLYARIWQMLSEMGLNAPSPVEARRRMRLAHERK